MSEKWFLLFPKMCLHGANQTVYGANSISMTTLFGQTKLYTGNGIGFDTLKAKIDNRKIRIWIAFEKLNYRVNCRVIYRSCVVSESNNTWKTNNASEIKKENLTDAFIILSGSLFVLQHHTFQFGLIWFDSARSRCYHFRRGTKKAVDICLW